MKYKLIILCVLVGGSALLTAGRAQGGHKEPALQVNPVVTHTLIDSIRQYLIHNYVFPDTAKKMIAYIEEQFKNGAYKEIGDPEKLAAQLQQDLLKVHYDGHFNIHYAPRRARDIADTTDAAIRSGIDDSVERANNFGFRKVELLPGNIGYVLFNGFSPALDEARPVITATFRFVSHARALIIDLRDNGGGRSTMVDKIESYFFASKAYLMDIIEQGDTIKVWTDPKNAEGVSLQMPVYLLTSKHTYSAAEAFTYSLQSIKRVMVVGDTTGGAAHITREFTIGQGFVMSIPLARSVNPYTHKDWEGVGVIPDIPVSADRALEAAQAAIYRDYITRAHSDKERNSAQWLLDDLVARQSKKIPDSAALSKYTGTYQGGLVFYIKGSDLYCKNAERRNEIFRLIPISGYRFILDNNVHVEFKKDEKGIFSSLDMLWKSGDISSKQKEQ